jgi:8-oxo-dGTP pyrophosphatase MutT (NUDIX family)
MTASVPVPAATILMLRDGPKGLEVFMVVRHHQIDFASGALVFPGGKIDKGDSEAAAFCDGITDATSDQVALQVGAIREAFEECGVLLARAAGDSELISGARLQTLDPYREKIHQGDMSFVDFLAQEQLRLACDQLKPFAHWVTPDMMPKRFDTWFYLAAAPTDHLAIHDGSESVDSVWISPPAALEGAQQGTYTIIFPTRLNIEMLAESDSLDAAFADAEARTIKTVLPWTEQRAEGNYLCIPSDAGYAISEEKLPER